MEWTACGYVVEEEAAYALGSENVFHRKVEEYSCDEFGNREDAVTGSFHLDLEVPR